MLDRSALVILARSRWFDTIAANLANAPKELRKVRDLARVGDRALELDAEDFMELASGYSTAWAKQLRACGFPDRPRSQPRGALGSLVPLFELMLEALDVRQARGEPVQVAIIAHLMGEYLPLLAWESTLGHAGDPARLNRSVGQRWGTDDAQCPHPPSVRAAARRSLQVAKSDETGFLSYLDRFHSRLGVAFSICGTNHETVPPGVRPDAGASCPNPCSWALRGGLEARRDLDARLRLAQLFANSPLVALRHHAPTGHFFGVPSEEEIAEAWGRTWDRLTAQWPDDSNPMAGRGRPNNSEVLPGLAELVSAVAGRPMVAGTLLAEIADDLESLLLAST